MSKMSSNAAGPSLILTDVGTYQTLDSDNGINTFCYGTLAVPSSD